jgi:hypothetical protein
LFKHPDLPRQFFIRRPWGIDGILIVVVHEKQSPSAAFKINGNSRDACFMGWLAIMVALLD